MLATATATATAIVFVLSKHVFPDTPRYISYCIDRGYTPLGVIKGDLSVALALLEAGTVQVIVFAQRARQVVDEGPTCRLPDRVSGSARPRNQLRNQIRGVASDAVDGSVTAEILGKIEAYRDGYADGFVDSVTLRG